MLLPHRFLARSGARYQSLPTVETKPIDPGAPSTITLPIVTNSGDQTKNHVVLHVESLPNLTGSCARGAKPIGVFGLVMDPLPFPTNRPFWLCAIIT
jgi:hypothetical protein